MSVLIDRDGAELRALFAATDFRGSRVLEVGCGEGRLMRRYAHLPALVVGLDPNPQGLSAAAASTAGLPAVRCVQAPAAPLPFRDGTFDVALFGWSL